MEDPDVCCVCLEPMNENNVKTLKCQHVLCSQCYKKWRRYQMIRLKQNFMCPQCRSVEEELRVVSNPFPPHSFVFMGDIITMPSALYQHQQHNNETSNVSSNQIQMYSRDHCTNLALFVCIGIVTTLAAITIWLIVRCSHYTGACTYRT